LFEHVGQGQSPSLRQSIGPPPVVLELLALPVLPALPVLARPSPVVTTPEHASMVTTGSTQAIMDRSTAGAPSKRRAAKNLEDLAGRQGRVRHNVPRRPLHARVHRMVKPFRLPSALVRRMGAPFSSLVAPSLAAPRTR
jgi:hypothetical protein